MVSLSAVHEVFILLIAPAGFKGMDELRAVIIVKKNSIGLILAGSPEVK